MDPDSFHFPFCRYEAWTLFILYIFYIILMYFNPRLEKFMVATFPCCPVRRKEELPMTVLNQNGDGPHHQKVPHSKLEDVDDSSDESVEGEWLSGSSVPEFILVSVA